MTGQNVHPGEGNAGGRKKTEGVGKRKTWVSEHRGEGAVRGGEIRCRGGGIRGQEEIWSPGKGTEANIRVVERQLRTSWGGNHVRGCFLRGRDNCHWGEGVRGDTFLRQWPGGRRPSDSKGSLGEKWGGGWRGGKELGLKMWFKGSNRYRGQKS